MRHLKELRIGLMNSVYNISNLLIMNLIEFEDFTKVEMRVGTVLSVKLNEKARKAAYILEIDFGEIIGIKKSSAQITENYSVDDLLGSQVVAVMNFPVKRVAGVKSEVLVLAAVDREKGNVLVRPSMEVDNGTRIF